LVAPVGLAPAVGRLYRWIPLCFAPSLLVIGEGWGPRGLCRDVITVSNPGPSVLVLFVYAFCDPLATTPSLRSAGLGAG